MQSRRSRQDSFSRRSMDSRSWTSDVERTTFYIMLPQLTGRPQGLTLRNVEIYKQMIDFKRRLVKMQTMNQKRETTVAKN
jgi:hypothetical protein